MSAKGSRRQSHSRGLSAPPRKRNAHQPRTIREVSVTRPRSHDQVLASRPATGQVRKVIMIPSHVKTLPSNPNASTESAQSA